MPLAERMKLAEGKPLRCEADGGDGAAGLRPVRLQLQDYSEARSSRQAEERLNLCVPGGKETARMVKALAEEIGKRAGGADAGGRSRRAAPAAPRRARRAVARQSGRRRHSCRARCSTGRARRRRPGTSSSISPACGLDYVVGDAFGLFPANDPALVDAVITALGAPAGLSDRRRARCARC